MTGALIAGLGALMAVAGGLLLYLASPNQRLTERRIARRPAALAGMIAELAALACFLAVAGPATAVFIWLTAAMTLWSIAPLATFRRGRKDRAR